VAIPNFIGAPEFGDNPAIVFFKDRKKPLYLPAGLLPAAPELGW